MIKGYFYLRPNFFMYVRSGFSKISDMFELFIMTTSNITWKYIQKILKKRLKLSYKFFIENFSQLSPDLGMSWR